MFYSLKHSRGNIQSASPHHCCVVPILAAKETQQYVQSPEGPASLGSCTNSELAELAFQKQTDNNIKLCSGRGITFPLNKWERNPVATLEQNQLSWRPKASRETTYLPQEEFTPGAKICCYCFILQQLDQNNNSSAKQHSRAPA